MVVDGAAPTGLLGWISEYGNVVYFFGQLIFWLGMLILLAYAVAQYKRYVNYTLGVGRSGKLRSEDRVAEAPLASAAPATEVAHAPAMASAEKPSIEEFVD